MGGLSFFSPDRRAVSAPQIFSALHMGRSASFRASWRGSQRDPESRNFKDFWMLAFPGMHKDGRGIL
jgi:hypothetical protein